MTQQKELPLRSLVMGNASRMIYWHKSKGCLLKWSPRVAVTLIKAIRIPGHSAGVAERGDILNCWNLGGNWSKDVQTQGNSKAPLN